jgi:hypothetical protein
VTHPWFNYLHSVELTPDGTFLLASAGSDLITEVTPDGDIVWEWFGPEHGYGTRQDGGDVYVDREADYRLLRSATSAQAMHVTSAIRGPDDNVLATLFHQGSLISIDRSTGCTKLLLESLSRPHGIHRRGHGFLLSDTLGHRILLLDSTYQLRSVIPFGSDWLQDAISTSSGTYLTLENVHIDQLPEPGLRNRVTEIDSRGFTLRELDVGPDCRLFTICEVDPSFASVLARLWGRSGSFGNWNWA